VADAKQRHALVEAMKAYDADILAVLRSTDTRRYRGCTLLHRDDQWFCPLCLKPMMKFDRHHVIWKTEKRWNGSGSNHHSNLLAICRRCHALLTFADGDLEGRLLNMQAQRFMMLHYGLLFALQIRQLRPVLRMFLLRGSRVEVDLGVRQAGFELFLRGAQALFTKNIEHEFRLIENEKTDSMQLVLF
jgi:hypothetical protein